MAELSYSDINEAKRRVREMRERAREYATDDKVPSDKENKVADNNEHQHKNKSSNIFDSLSALTSGEDSSKAIILALILILSNEKADNMLILALLYILL